MAAALDLVEHVSDYCMISKRDETPLEEYKSLDEILKAVEERQ